MSYCFGSSRFTWSLLAATMLVSTAFAGGDGPVIGRAIAARGAALDGTPIRYQDLVFSGNVLTTETGARAVVQFHGASEAEVLEDSVVRFAAASGGIPRAQIVSGAILARASRKGVVVQTLEHQIEPSDQQRTIFFVEIFPGKTTFVAALHGAVVISDRASGKQFSLGEGQYAISIAGAAGPQQAEPNEQAPGKPAGQAPTPQTAPPKPQPPPAQQRPPQPRPARVGFHIGPLNTAESIAVLAAAAGGAVGIGVAASSGGGAASPSTP
jgi:hypothetical protein